MFFRYAILAATGAFIAAAAPAHAALTNFAGQVGASTPFSSVSSTNTLSFTDGVGGGAFVVENSLAGLVSFSTGLVDQSFTSGDSLTIGFATAVTGVEFPFAIQDAFSALGSDFITVTSNAGTTQSFGGSPDGLTLQEPEGWATFVGPAFTSLTITSANPYIVGDIQVPEPMSMALLSVGVAGLAGIRRRRRRA